MAEGARGVFAFHRFIAHVFFHCHFIIIHVFLFLPDDSEPHFQSSCEKISVATNRGQAAVNVRRLEVIGRVEQDQIPRQHSTSSIVILAFPPVFFSVLFQSSPRTSITFFARGKKE